MINSKQFFRYKCLLAAFSLFFAMGCHTHKSTFVQTPENVHIRLLDSLDMELKSLSKKSLMPGFAVALVNSEAVLFSQGYGNADAAQQRPFTDQTIHGVASISKTFIGLALMQLVEAGKLDLDESINSILPYKITHPAHPDKAITVKHLATHTSALSQEFDPEDVGEATIFLLEEVAVTPDMPEDFRDALAYYQMGKPITIDQHIQKFTQPSGNWYTESNFQSYAPGEKFDYTNLDAVIAARIVEIRSGMSFEAYTKKYIFEPLGMTHTGWHERELDAALLSEIYMPDDNRNPNTALRHPRYEMTDYPAGGLKTTAADLSKYLMEMIRGYEGKGKLLGKQAYQTLFSPQLPDSCFENRNDYLFNDQYSVGIFWAISPTGYRLHNGGSIGIYSFLYFDPKTRSGALAFCNLPVPDFGQVREIAHKYQQLLAK